MNFYTIVLLLGFSFSAHAEPVWLQDPMTFTGMVRCNFFQRLNIYVRDDGQNYTFSKRSGPDWLTVSKEGHVSGSPTGAEETLQIFKIDATKDGETSTGTLEVWLEERDPPC